MRNMSPPKCGSGWPISVSNYRPRLPTSRPDRSRPPGRRLTDRIVDGLDFPAFAGLQRAVLSAAGVLGDRRPADAADAAMGPGAACAMLGAQQHLADARGLQHKSRIPRRRENPEGTADRRVEASVDVGNLRAAAVL